MNTKKTAIKKSLGIISLVLFTLDRITKYWIQKSNFSLEGKLVKINLVKNEDLFFFPVNKTLLLTISTAVLIGLSYAVIKSIIEKKNILTLGLFLILLGGISNMADRIFLGYALDWIWVIIYPLATFNVADIMITFGIIILIFQHIKHPSLVGVTVKPNHT